ncbi:MAG: hypothetical protein IPK19_40555 [Chloroflexi bacterium]|nr:hypothetical protein [Chloroflexota bacterium]
MNDDFLRKHRKAPNRAFAEDLYRRLKAEEDDSAALPMTRIAARRGPFPIGAAAVLAVSTPPQLTQIETGFFDSLQPIGVNNADDLVEIARLGTAPSTTWIGMAMSSPWAAHAGYGSTTPEPIRRASPARKRRTDVRATGDAGQYGRDWSSGGRTG